MTDEEVRKALYDKNNIRVMKQAIWNCGGKIPYDARMDIMQDSLLRCLDKHDDKYGRKFTTSLYRFTVWECRKFIRTRKRRYRDTVSLSSIPNITLAVFDRQEDVEHVRECMDLIPEEDRILIEQYFMMGMTFKEIGDIKGYTSQAAMINVRKAVQKLKRICTTE